MPNLKDSLMRIFNKIFRSNRFPMIANVSKENYDEYRKTYDTLSKVFSKTAEIDLFLVGGISAAIQADRDLYRQNSDIDIMCREEHLAFLVKVLHEAGYNVDDKRGIKTRNTVDVNGQFHAMDHELNANPTDKKLLGVGIFTYSFKGNEVVTRSYSYHESKQSVIGIERVMPRELFNLMYDSSGVVYKGIKLKTQSKEYIYLTKIASLREKDKLDASIIEPTLDDESKRKIARIRELETRVKEYRLLLDKDGKVEIRERIPTFEDKVNNYLYSLYMNSSTKTPEQVINDILQSKQYRKMVIERPEIDTLIKKWQEKTKNYTYRDKIKLVTHNYSRKLQDFDKSAIDNALDFFQRRQQNHGKDGDDIELTDDAKKIFELMSEYGQLIKKIFVDNGISLTHITSVAPEKLDGGVLRKSIDRANNYETGRVDGVFASSTPVDGNNPYIARNSSGMIRLSPSTYIYGNDNIDVVQDSNGASRAILRRPNYIYHINPYTFNPVCNITIDSRSRMPVFEFSEEWISSSEVDISDPNQVRVIECVTDITSLLEHYTILCDTKSQRIGISAKKCRSKSDALKFISEKIEDGSVRNINHEAGINDINLSDIER